MTRIVVRPCDEIDGRTWNVVEVTSAEYREVRRTGGDPAGRLIASGFATRTAAREYARRERGVS